MARFLKDDSGVLGLHLNMMGLRPGIDLGTATQSADEQPWLATMGTALDDKTGFAAFPADLAPAPPREWIERAFNLRHHTVMPGGGHFAALEEPDLMVEDIRAFFRPLRYGAAND